MKINDGSEIAKGENTWTFWHVLISKYDYGTAEIGI
jgi:hypothetical protein